MPTKRMLSMRSGISERTITLITSMGRVARSTVVSGSIDIEENLQTIRLRCDRGEIVEIEMLHCFEITRQKATPIDC